MDGSAPGPTQADLERLAQLRDNFPYYAQNCLKVRSEAGAIVPFEINEAQAYVDRQLDNQLAETGKVRAIVLKARQWGCSTYVGGRFFHRVTYREGVKAFILTHRSDATNNLFSMVERFYENLPAVMSCANGVDIQFAPGVDRANAKELTFEDLDSGYRVGTASATSAATVGRGDTFQFFHGSEVAFWENAEEAVSGALQAVPNIDGTEIILESTANGIGGVFHQMCRAAQEGQGEFRLIFVPWHIHRKYRRTPPDSFDWPADPEDQDVMSWIDYGEIHKLDDDQLYWAYIKNAELAVAVGADPDRGPCWKFLQEYPANIDEAFQAGGDERFVPSKLATAARRRAPVYRKALPVIIGVDISRGGDDYTWMIDRNGRAAGELVNERLKTDNEMEIAGRLCLAIDRVREMGYTVIAYVDTTGAGGGVVDRCIERGYTMVNKVGFGNKAIEFERFANKRAEMWGLMKEWFEDEAGVSIPDDDVLHGDICSVVWGQNATRFDSNSRIVLEPKENVKKRLGRSPDGGDALCCTFAEPVGPGFEDMGPTPVPPGNYV